MKEEREDTLWQRCAAVSSVCERGKTRSEGLREDKKMTGGKEGRGERGRTLPGGGAAFGGAKKRGGRF